MALGENSKKISFTIYPNPVAERAIVKVNIPVAGEMRLLLFDMNGEKILELNNGFCSEGEHHYSFSKEQLKTGVYLCSLITKGQVISKRVTIL
ncbi:T9SS type A sorting domain-containing protein [Prolixibacteraceae bacterium JC049]|nr:T9SS type A sorting domain-containing protein [Prolixibacteraceae bacterium JC049]